MTIKRLKHEAGELPQEAKFDAQLQACTTRMTRSGKPYLELTFVDATGNLVVKAWDNHPQFSYFEGLAAGTFVHVAGAWTKNQYGMDAAKWDVRPLNADEKETFLAGDAVTKERQDADWAYILSCVEGLVEPRLRALAEAFIKDFGPRFRRAAAARKNHHARRGGLVEHTAQMMRAAQAMGTAYRDLNVELMMVGILFHDCGKMWENCYAEDSFAQNVDLRGEMLGHISIGMELVNKLWRGLMDSSVSRRWIEEDVPSEHVRLHVLHLVASHHGQYDFGSPVLPRTPEAHALHHIDNFDAKYEMMKNTYGSGHLAAPGIYERQFPLPAGAVDPLPRADGVVNSSNLEEEMSKDVKSGFLF